MFKIRQEPITAAELTKARNLLVGHYELSLQTHGAQAMEMGLNETYDLGQDFGTRYIKELEAVTPERVLEIARKYIQPDHYIMVTVGAEAPQEEISPEDPDLRRSRP